MRSATANRFGIFHGNATHVRRQPRQNKEKDGIAKHSGEYGVQLAHNSEGDEELEDVHGVATLAARRCRRETLTSNGIATHQQHVDDSQEEDSVLVRKGSQTLRTRAI